MRQLAKYSVIVFAFIASYACQELITLPLEEEQTRVVIEGLISDDSDQQFIKVSESLNYYASGQLQPIEDATVSLLSDDRQLVQAFNYSAADSAFLPTSTFVAETGKDYILEVMANGEVYQAKGQLKVNANLDSLYYLSREQLQETDQNVFEGDYFIFVDGSINSNQVEYFRLTVTVNDTLRNSRGDIANSIFSSEFFGQEFNFLPVPGNFKAKDSVSLALYSLTEDTYQYYIEFSNLLFNDGGVFSPPPVNPSSNIINTTNEANYALGFIQFSALLQRELYIDEEE